MSGNTTKSGAGGGENTGGNMTEPESLVNLGAGRTACGAPEWARSHMEPAVPAGWVGQSREGTAPTAVPRLGRTMDVAPAVSHPFLRFLQIR